MGDYERLRQQDETSILRLKDQLSSLSLENVALARAASTEPPEVEEEEEEEGRQDVAEKLVKLKNRLIEMGSGSDDLYEILSIPGEENWKLKCGILEDRLERLKTESPSPGKLEEYLVSSAHTVETSSAQYLIVVVPPCLEIQSCHNCS